MTLYSFPAFARFRNEMPRAGAVRLARHIATEMQQDGCLDPGPRLFPGMRVLELVTEAPPKPAAPTLPEAALAIIQDTLRDKDEVQAGRLMAKFLQSETWTSLTEDEQQTFFDLMRAASAP